MAICEAQRPAPEPEDLDLPGPAVIIEEELRVPAASHTLAGFRGWVLSRRFLLREPGRFDTWRYRLEHEG